MTTVHVDADGSGGGAAVSVANYLYNGVGHVVSTDYPEPDVMSLAYAIGSYDSGLETVTINGIPVPIYTGTENEAQDAFAGNLNCIHHGCSASASIVITGALDVSADGLFYNWVAAANASIFESRIGLKMTPSSDTCDIVNDGHEFFVNDCWEWSPDE